MASSSARSVPVTPPACHAAGGVQTGLAGSRGPGAQWGMGAPVHGRRDDDVRPPYAVELAELYRVIVVGAVPLAVVCTAGLSRLAMFVLRLTSDDRVIGQETDDGFTGEEGSFTICSFWLVSALCEIGEYHRAKKLCARLLAAAGPLDLYAEEIDSRTGQHLGNFPQAFTHLALINAVLHVIELEEQQQD